MKKILFVIPTLAHGGTNKSLENILEFLKKYPYDISIYSIELNQTRPYYQIFKKYLIIHKDRRIYNLINPIKKSGFNILYCGILKIFRSLCYLAKKDYTLYLCKKTAQHINNNYDIVIGFQEGIATILANFIPAQKKIAWVHCDYGVVTQSYKELYYNFNKIICVSEYTLNSFNSVLPHLSKRTKAIYNIVNSTLIFKKANQIDNIGVNINKRQFNIVSVGRIDYIKRFKEIPSIAYELQKRNIQFHWYIIGDYNTQEGKELIKNIERYKSTQYITLTGSRDNPYNIMNQCQLYVCLSISEACPYVINEARILHLPIVCTDFPSSYEFIKNGENGFICQFEKITDTIANLITDNTLYQQIKSNIKDFIYDNKIIEKNILSILKDEENFDK